MTGAADVAAQPEQPAELVLPYVVRIERAAPPGRTDALEAASQGVLQMLSGECWSDQISAWDGQRIRKVVRRARGADWRRAEALDGVTVRRGSAEVRVFPPIPIDGWPPELARLQVGGTELTDPGPPPPPPPGVVLILLSPRHDMTAGKAMAQAAHAAQLGWRASSPDQRAAWRDSGFELAVRDADDDRWAAALELGAPVVRDAGFTEVTPGARTALVVLPWPARGQSSD